MQTGKTAKYFKYAIGEIILVVIGILIALQINTWNQNRILKAQEIKVLQNFKKSINRDIEDLERSKITYGISQKAINYLIEYLEQDLPYKDSLAIHFHDMMYDFGIIIDISVFEALKSKDLNLISNDSLRENIINYYSYANTNVMKYTTRYSEIIEDASKTIFNKHFDAIWNNNFEDYFISSDINELSGTMVPLDYKVLKTDKQFRYFLKSLKNQQGWLIQLNLKQVDYYTETILNLIDKELDSIKR